ncbi:MAG: hypothetical protein AB1705_01115 [Verrucomicrobiota bacterium]
MTRREFTTTLALATASAPLTTFAASRSRRPKVALLATEVKRYSHAQHFVDRLLEGYGWRGAHHRPPLELAGFYVDQFPDNDLARERAQRHNLKIYPTIAEALTLGTSKLAVDGVLIIGEHGDYPKNEKGQRLYPRYKWFKEIVEVFERTGRSVPVFNDKHLSTDWPEAVEMVEESRRLGFAFLAGSSLPVTWRIPSLELPINCALEESVCACYGGIDSYDFHGLETAQCMSERRAGGEAGVKSIHAVQGDIVWEMLKDRPQTRDLLLAALSRSHTLSAPEGYTFAVPSFEPLRVASPNTTAYFIEHLDGFRTSMFLLNGNTASVAGLDQKSRDALWLGRSVRDFTYAGRLKNGKVESCKFHLPMPPWYATLADFFNPLMNHIETTVIERKAPYPVERTLLTTGMTTFAVESLFQKQPLATPELKVPYRAPSESNFWRA